MSLVPPLLLQALCQAVQLSRVPGAPFAPAGTVSGCAGRVYLTCKQPIRQGACTPCPGITLPFYISQLIRDYSTPPNEELSRDLVAKLKPHIR